jgi:predicted neutral ceramidase superfamily lipid hydrolase
MCKKIPCSAGTSAVDICIISVEERELVLGAYGVSCRTLSRHRSNVCDSLVNSGATITGSLLVVLILCVAIGIAIASIIIYVNRKNKQNLSVHQEPDNVLMCKYFIYTLTITMIKQL